MAKFNKTDHKLQKGEAPSSLDQALLDEFFSIIASVAIRLTKTEFRGKNADNPIEQEVNER